MKQIRQDSKKLGFTLIELLVAIAILGIFMTASVSMIINMNKAYNKITIQIRDQQEYSQLTHIFYVVIHHQQSETHPWMVENNQLMIDSKVYIAFDDERKTLLYYEPEDSLMHEITFQSIFDITFEINQTYGFLSIQIINDQNIQNQLLFLRDEVS